MSSRLEDALIFVKPMPSCVMKITPLENDKVACFTGNKLHILNSSGDETSKHHIPEEFVVVQDRILFINYDREVKDYRIDFLYGDKILKGEKLKIGGYFPSFILNGDDPDSFSIVARGPSEDINNRVKICDFQRDIRSGRILVKRSSRAVPCHTVLRNAFVSQNAPLEIFVSTADGNLYAFKKGTLSWKREYPAEIDGCDEYQGNLVFGSKSGRFVSAFRLQGETRQLSKDPTWTHSAIGPVLSILIPNEKTVLVGTEGFGGRLYAFDLERGEEKLKHEMPKNFGIWSMTYKKGKEGVLYLGTGIGGKGRVYALDYKALKLEE